ncbi:class I SAM-dependent methyltransferase [Pseudonocardia sp. TRM90224]|uniref:class I SAM-dependent methyltransferase n=1 Tax=Pseudonocardia sp. TRM90224 TaxID=2812678 RepID=UPI001E413723|nr:methyltransferase domain-containing protein [Pseudonocardia sp. TRM90224]
MEGGAALYDAVLDRAGIGSGTTVLDLGCGSGAFAAAAVASGAVVTGIDVDRSAVAAAAELVPSATFRVGDAHDPPPGPFEVVTAVQLLAHVTNPVLVLRRAAAVGGLVVATVWGRESESDVRAFGEALAPWVPPARSAGGPPPVTEPARLVKLAGLAGLVDATIDEVPCPFTYPDADALLADALASGIGRRAVAAAGAKAVRNAVLTRLEGNRTPAGAYQLANLFRVLVARGRP